AERVAGQLKQLGGTVEILQPTDIYRLDDTPEKIGPAVTTIDALARALRLSKTEHAHLKALARDGARSPFTREIVPPPIRRMIESLPQPAYITGRRWDVLAWNDAAEDIFAFGQLTEQDRNTLLLVLTNKQTRKFYGASWTDVAKSMVAMFRATHDVWAGDPAFTELLMRLRQGSPEFVKWWEAHDIRSTMSGLKTMNHPTRGVLRFEHTSFQANDDPALKLVIYTPV
ncbi:hypothetical protein, partial [Bradyrhizobium sp. SHOUNA76]|uniref:MmyB family transcriptional regulator n=1 Tax=Bradyrhizobium sp. SHOUNA76 TaxID=2908927 RepID=UPI001FF4BB89